MALQLAVRHLALSCSIDQLQAGFYLHIAVWRLARVAFLHSGQPSLRSSDDVDKLQWRRNCRNGFSSAAEHCEQERLLPQRHVYHIMRCLGELLSLPFVLCVTFCFAGQMRVTPVCQQALRLPL
jgi:hypothetical protein